MLPQPLRIDPDIARASTLPARLYSDPAAFDAVKEKVLAKSWQFVGDTDSLKSPGQTMPITLLEGSLDEPLLLTRDWQDTLHCLSNVCTHRGTVLCEHSGREKSLVCRYHGRRFDLDGTCKHMPEFDKVVGFPAPGDHLPKIPFGLWRKFLFAGASPAEPLDKLLAEMSVRVGFLPLEQFFLDPTRCRDYLVHANWALYCDNYLEGFHIPFVHPSLNQALDYGAYSTELFPLSNLQLGIAAGGSEAFDLPPGHPDHGKRVAAYYFWLFPNTMFNFYPWGLSINVVRPLAIDRTKVSFLTYLWRPEKLDSGAGSGLDRVEREDEAIVEAVQRGTRSRFYSAGRYSPTREQGVHHFHRLLTSALA